MKFTVLGAGGFIGNHLAKALKDIDGAVIYAPQRQGKSDIFDEVLRQELGNVFYCIGLTANFRNQPYDTVEAHVCMLKRLLEHGKFESLTYLSSTRVYEGAPTTQESAVLHASPENPGHIYNLSKMMGESLCFASGRNVRIARLSNVFGIGMSKNNFIGQILKSAVDTGHIDFLTTPDSAKDYISIADVTQWLPKIALSGKHAIYNIAHGQNTSNMEIARFLEQKGFSVHFAKDAETWSFPDINTSRLVNEYGVPQHSLLKEFDSLLNSFAQLNL